MLNKYMYFIAIAEELSISKAAQRLFISHQGLSAYVKNLEEHYGVRLLHRQPKISLTAAGSRLIEFYRQIEFMDKNLVAQFKDMKNEVHGNANIGMVKGRYRILAPVLLKEYKDLYPNVKLNIHSDDSWNLKKQLLNNEIELFLSTGVLGQEKTDRINRKVVMEEDVHLVISDNLLKKEFGENWQKVKEEFVKGADLHKLKNIPFVLPEKNFTSRITLDGYLRQEKLNLNIVLERMHPDIHHLLSKMDYAASICLSMYVKGILRLNQSRGDQGSYVNVFPIKGLQSKSVVKINSLNGAIFPKYILDLIGLIEKLCLFEK